MASILRLLVIPLSVLLGLQAASAETSTISGESTRQLDTQQVQYHQHMRRRAARHNHEVARRARSRQVVSKSTSPTVAKTDVLPIQILVEAMLLQVTLTKADADSGVNFALLDASANHANSAKDGTVTQAAFKSMTGFDPATVPIANGAPARPAAKDTNGLKIAWITGSSADFLRALEPTHEVKVLACPRLLTLNKQLADVHLGDRLYYQTVRQTDDATIEEVKWVPIGTQLQVRPFVASDGRIRLEVLAARSTGHLDSHGIPQTDTVQITTNLLMPDGATVVLGGPTYVEVTQDHGVLSFLSGIPYLDSLLPSTDVATHKQLIVLLTSHIYRQ
jgi:general secretion pathway protein D